MPHQCPSHQSILLIQGTIFQELEVLKNSVFFSRPFWFFFFFQKKKFFASFPWKSVNTHCFVQGNNVAFEISTWIWQKKIVNRFEQFWVEICLKLRTSQTFINCDLKHRLPQMGPNFLKSLSNFLFRTTFKSMLGRVIWPGFWILQTKFFR